MIRKLLLVIALTCVTVVLTACSENATARSVPPKQPDIVKTTAAQLQSVADVLEIPAKVQADPDMVVHIYPPAGGRLLQVRVRPGDHVSRGQTVAVEESSDIGQARSDYAKAKSEFEKNTRELARTQLLFQHKAFSQRQLEEAQANYDESKSELDRATDHLKVLGASIEGSSSVVNLVAPRSGSVLDIGAASGELSKSTDNANSIATIADLKHVWVVGDVFEKDLAGVKKGESVEVTLNAYPGRVWQAKIDAISDTLDAQSRTIKARVILANPNDELKPEMFATIRVRRPASRAIVLPATAVLHDGGDTAVMIETKPGIYERRLIGVRSANAQQVVIASGVQPGEIVVTEGAALLRGGGE